MAEKFSLLLIVTALLVFSTTNVDAGDDYGFNPVPAKSRCEGSIAECMGVDLEMDSEISRRILATTNYISYGALQANSVPCSQKGASYYNCQAGAQANPYDRGCSAIARCRS